MESEATRGEEGALILARDGQSGDEVDLGVGFHGADEIGAGDGFDGARAERLGSDAVGGLLVQSGQAEDVAGAGDAEEEETAVAGGGSDFHARPLAEGTWICSAGKALVEEDRVARAVTAAVSQRVEVAQGVWRGSVEEALGAVDRAVQTAVRENGWASWELDEWRRRQFDDPRGDAGRCTGLLSLRRKTGTHWLRPG